MAAVDWAIWHFIVAAPRHIAEGVGDRHGGSVAVLAGHCGGTHCERSPCLKAGYVLDRIIN